MYKWSKKSVKNINTVNGVLQILAQKIIQKVKYDIGVLDSGGLRTPVAQNKIFLAGNSKCDGYKKLSYHQSGKAIDFVPFVNKRYSWSNVNAFLSIAKVVFECWADMVVSGENQNYYLHWGGFWNAKDLDKDGLLEITDKLGWDAAHYELRVNPQKNKFKIRV